MNNYIKQYIKTSSVCKRQ